MNKRGLPVLFGAVVLGLMSMPALRATEHNTFDARLRGDKEVCAVAECNDPNGRGHAAIRLKRADRRICFSIRWRQIEAPYAAHVHSGEAGVEGPVEATLFSARDLSRGVKRIGGCARAARSLMDAIKENPSAFYVNVHTPSYEGGAIRGQLR